MGERKISLEEAQLSGAIGITIYCSGAAVAAGGCRHAGHMEIETAIATWGGNRTLDDLRLVCSRCGSREVDVRPQFNNAPDSASHKSKLAL